MKSLQNSKHTLLTLCALILCTVLCAVSISAADVVNSGQGGDSITWTLYDDGSLVFEGTGAMWDYESQEETPYIDYLEDITSVEFKSGITYIGAITLVRYPYLASISIPDTVTSIGEGAFFGCESLTSIVFPDSITEIGSAVIANCYSLESVVLSEKLTSIPDNTFQNNFALKSVTVPDSVTSLGMAAFGWCYSLETVTLPENLTEIGSAAFIECSALESIRIPDSVTYIGDIPFQYCYNLKTVSLPENLTSISYGMFYNCYALESVNIPETVTLIEPYAFSSCQSIQNLCIPAAVTEIGEGAFAYCFGLTIEIAEGQEHYICDENGGLFTADMTRLLFFPHNSGLETYAIPDGVVSIDTGAFHDDCSLASVSIPASVTEIGENAFGAAHFITAYSVDENNPSFSADEHGVLFNKDKTELIQYPIGRENGSYTVPDSVINIRSEAFAYSLTLTDITMGANVETIGTGAFQCCENLNNFTLPESLRSADAYAFSECYALTSMTLPENMEYLGDYAFSNSYNLTEVNVLSPNMEYAWDIFASVPAETFTLYGLIGSTTEAYAADWGYTFAEYVPPTFLPGDISGDGVIDINDAMMLFQYSMIPHIFPIDYEGNTDFNGDGNLDISDAMRLFQHSMLPDQFPLE